MFLQVPFFLTYISSILLKQTLLRLSCAYGVHVCFIIVVQWQLVLCLVSMGTLLLGKVKPLTNEPNPLSTFCSAAGQRGSHSQQSNKLRGHPHIHPYQHAWLTISHMQM